MVNKTKFTMNLENVSLENCMNKIGVTLPGIQNSCTTYKEVDYRNNCLCSANKELDNLYLERLFSNAILLTQVLDKQIVLKPENDIPSKPD